jgi:CRISPR-associated protein Cst2
MIQSLSISGLLTLELHALNNEGAEGNTMMTRMVDVIVKDGAAAKKHTVNAISGDMFKHIFVEHLIAEAKSTGLPLCQGCQIFDPNRICYPPAWEAINKSRAWNKDTKDSEILRGVIQTCLIDDAAGILITGEVGGKSRSVARKSSVEFGWVVGRPAEVSTESFFHAKYVAEGRDKGSGDSSNTGQNIFHRPASSGRYAVVLNLDLYKIGRNDISLEYDLDPDARQARIAAVLRAVAASFVKPTGAHRNTQHPHIVDFEGVVSLSASTLPAPMISALNPDFVTQIEKIAAGLNALSPNKLPIVTHSFDSLGSFVDRISLTASNLES